MSSTATPLPANLNIRKLRKGGKRKIWEQVRRHANFKTFREGGILVMVERREARSHNWKYPLAAEPFIVRPHWEIDVNAIYPYVGQFR